MQSRIIEINFRHKEIFFFIEGRKIYRIQYPLVPERKAANV